MKRGKKDKVWDEVGEMEGGRKRGGRREGRGVEGGKGREKGWERRK